jgi:hypothetical protein
VDREGPTKGRGEEAGTLQGQAEGREGEGRGKERGRGRVRGKGAYGIQSNRKENIENSSDLQGQKTIEKKRGMGMGEGGGEGEGQGKEKGREREGTCYLLPRLNNVLHLSLAKRSQTSFQNGLCKAALVVKTLKQSTKYINHTCV